MTPTPPGPQAALRRGASPGPSAASPSDLSTGWARLSHGESREFQGLRATNGTVWLNSRPARQVAQLAQSAIVGPTSGASAPVSADESPPSDAPSAEPPSPVDESELVEESCSWAAASALALPFGPAVTPASSEISTPPPVCEDPGSCEPVGNPSWGGSGCGFRAQESPRRRPKAQKTA
jgi:hypothetical protein